MSTRYLRRYSELTALFYLLSTRKLTLVDPKSWEDGNDQLLSTPGCALRYSILSLTAAHLPDPEIFAASSTNLESSGSIDALKSRVPPFVETSTLAGQAVIPELPSGVACLCASSARVLTCSCVQERPQSIHPLELTSLLLTDVQTCGIFPCVI